MIAIPPATCSQIESVQQIDQLRVVKLDAFRVVRSCQHLEGAAFETLDVDITMPPFVRDYRIFGVFGLRPTGG